MVGENAQREVCGTLEVACGLGLDRCAVEVLGPELGERLGVVGPIQEGGEGEDVIL